jgi:hypothetical protein
VGRITAALAAELDGLECTALAVTPGWLQSEAMLDHFGVTERSWGDATDREPHFCSSEISRIRRQGPSGPRRRPRGGPVCRETLTSGQLGRIYGVTDTDGSRLDGRSYVTEIEAPGLPARETGYR